MGIGTSLGAYYDDSFHQAAAQWNSKYDNNVMDPDMQDDATAGDKNIVDPVTKTPDFMTQVSDHSGFRPSDSIDDRRGDPYPSYSEQWEPMKQDIKNRLFGTQSIPEAPVSDLSKQLGHDQVELPKTIGDPIQDHIMQEVGRNWIFAKRLGTAINDTFVKGLDPYDTRLTDEEEKGFKDWKAKNAPNDSGKDYDLRGAYKADTQPDPDRGHMGDTFKKPNHPTFSDQSKYHDGNTYQGGHWGKTDDGKDTFTPGDTNVKTHGLLGLIDYFDREEPNAHLLIPKK